MMIDKEKSILSESGECCVGKFSARNLGRMSEYSRVVVLKTSNSAILNSWRQISTVSSIDILNA
jgi:hypothetical protein